MIPKHLKHKPIICIDNYHQYDGHFNATSTDAKFLSIGFAQYDNTNPEELTVKVFRFSGAKWSRQSEELPLHRCVDLCNLIVQSIMKVEGINYNHVNTTIRPKVEDKNGLVDIKNFYEKINPCIPSITCNQLKEKLRELRMLIDILNP